MQEKEIWKDVPGYEGYYQVSNLGNVKSLNRVLTMKDGRHKTVKEKIKAQRKGNHGYLCADLSLNSKQDTKLIHRLVGIAFVTNPENKPQINHKDGNKLNNHFINLEWCNNSENQKHAYSTGLKKAYSTGRFGKDSHLSKKVDKFDLDMNYICSYDSMRITAMENNVAESSISQACRGDIKSCKGFIYRLSN